MPGQSGATFKYKGRGPSLFVLDKRTQGVGVCRSMLNKKEMASSDKHVILQVDVRNSRSDREITKEIILLLLIIIDIFGSLRIKLL